jgi:cytidyltransferase-like protein
VTGNHKKKVFVSGCFDLLHSGHIAFFEEAASFGALYVAIGSDKTIFELKGREPVNNEDERLYMVKSLSMVKEAFISKGSGMLDFFEEMVEIKPDIFIVNTDGNTPDKRALCEELQIEYKILHREPHQGLPPRSTTHLRTILAMPYRIDVAGGWLDQPFVSRKHPGPVITISLEPTIDFNERSGMATSTRRTASELWGPKMPAGDYEKIAKILFCCDNPPGSKEISGSQDAIGLVYPGLAISHYHGEYWPDKIESVQDEETLQFIENALYLIPLGPRGASFSVLANTHITKKCAQALSEAAYACWDAILAHDLGAFGRYMRASFEAQISMFPNMIIPTILELIVQYREQSLGWKVSGAGGGGYLILVSDKDIEDALRVKIRRANG